MTHYAGLVLIALLCAALVLWGAYMGVSRMDDPFTRGDE